MSIIRQWFAAHLEARARFGIPSPDEFRYSCIEDFVNRRGVSFDSAPLTPEEARIVFSAVDACRMRFQRRECFYNAQLLVLADRSGDLVYHEGYAAGAAVIPVHHGWAAVGGKVVDLTWRLETPRNRGRMRDRVLGDFPGTWEYVGVPFPDRDYLRGTLVRRGAAGSLIDDWEQGFPLLRE